MASGAGRLFEACGALLGLAVSNDWEGESAVRLESLAASEDQSDPWTEVELVEIGGAPQIPSVELLAAAAKRLVDGTPPAAVASGFHTTFCALAVELTRRVAPPGIQSVALGGGCMVNRLLIQGLGDGLARAGLEPLIPVQVPPGDGGLSYGQSVLASVAAARDIEISVDSSSLR
jgi:hydrogenase maturation protein HypF